MDFYIFESEWPDDDEIIVADPAKILLSGQWTLVDQFSEGDGRYPAAKEAEIKEAIEDNGSCAFSRGPSFFGFARTERCQDAFVGWLLNWACERYGEVNEPLHQTGVFFLNRLLELHHITPPGRYDRVRIAKWKHIDLFVRVNTDILVLIEDKVDFVEHSDQLERYLDRVRTYYLGM
jgi:hypothetical protein